MEVEVRFGPPPQDTFPVNIILFLLVILLFLLFSVTAGVAILVLLLVLSMRTFVGRIFD